jgi:hypothetical protein
MTSFYGTVFQHPVTPFRFGFWYTFLSACSFGLFYCKCLHYMLRPNWPSSSAQIGFILQVFTRQLLLRWFFFSVCVQLDRFCGLVVKVLRYRSGGPGSIPGTTRKKVVGLERGPLSLVSTTEELIDRKVAAPV